MIWNKECETLARKDLEALALTRLQATVERVYAHVPFYKKKFDELGIKPSHIKSTSDVKHLPFTVKDDLRDNYPYGLFSVPMDDVVRVHASSGTTGKATVVGYTRQDIDTWSELMARVFSSGGMRKSDIVHNALAYGLFTGGIGFHYGIEKIGATVIPVSGGNTKRQMTILRDFASTVLTSTPSYALHLAEIAHEMGIDPAKDFKLRVGFFGAEPWSENMRNEIVQRFHIDTIDVYGLSEIIGPGVACECLEANAGLHIFEDHFLPEIIDSETGKVLPYGETGELVFTSLTKEAFPIIRYRTKDISRLSLDPCVCGRTYVRMDRVTGRTDDMLIIRGVNVFPSQIEGVLMDTDGIEPHYQLVVDREGALDTLEVQAEVNEANFLNGMAQLEKIETNLEKDISNLLGVTCHCKLVAPKTLPRSEGKAKRVIDNRHSHV